MRRKFSREFKLEAVKLVSARGVSVAQACRDLDAAESVLRRWMRELAEGFACGLHRVERLMKVNGLRARSRRRGLPKDDGERSVIADNLLDRDFQADRPNQKWLADLTYIWTAEG